MFMKGVDVNSFEGVKALHDHEEFMLYRGWNWEGYKDRYRSHGLTDLEAVVIYESDVVELLRLRKENRDGTHS